MDTAEHQLAAILSHAWWVLLLRGVVAIAFGVLVWLQPGSSFMALMWLFGAYLLADGILGVWMATTGRSVHEDWWVLLLWGLVGIGVGVMTFLAPGITGLALLFYIAIWAIATGVLEIVAAVRLRKEMEGEWVLVVGGLISVLFGAFLVARPAEGAMAMLWLIATYAVVFGILLMMLAFRVRAFGHRFVRHAHP
jgi:uncharacterized membrane protein HdeD (DUF308 family)